jgi:hypothetical protein
MLSAFHLKPAAYTTQISIFFPRFTSQYSKQKDRTHRDGLLFQKPTIYLRINGIYFMKKIHQNSRELDAGMAQPGA